MSETDDALPSEEGHDGPSARVELLIAEQFDGSALVYPVADPSLASYGSETEALAEQRRFLREYLGRVAPSSIARLSLPRGAALRSSLVVLPREEIRRKLRSDTEVSFHHVIVPAAAGEVAPTLGPGDKTPADLWVMIPNLDHTFYVEKGEVLDDAVRSEVARLLVAQDFSPWEVMGFLPARAHRLETAIVPLPEIEREGRGAAKRKAIADRARRKQAADALAAVSIPIHLRLKEKDKAREPLSGRDTELTLLGSLLDGQNRLGVLVIGAEHTGKSALVRAAIARTERPVYLTSGAQLIAGMSGLGQWQERIRAVMEAVEELDAVLYFESLEDLLAEQRESGGADLAGAMRPYLEEGKARILAEIRPEELDRLEARHWAFFASLSRMKLDPLSPADALIALQKRAAHDARTQPHRPQLDPAALPALIDLAERYLPYGAFPGKAIRLYNDLRAAREKGRGPGGGPPILSKADVFASFSLTTGVPELLLRDDLPLRVSDVAASLKKQIIGQDEAITALAETIGVVKAGLQPQNKPLATFLFIGPTGVGKTELARALAEVLFGGSERLLRFDMSEFMTPDAAERLIRGTDRADGLLTRAVREQPFCVLLLDEIEKAHPAVFDLLLQVAGEGRLSDARGKTAYFHNAILIMTSNLGAGERRSQVGFAGAVTTDHAHYRKLVNSAFRPEFVNRLDRIVPFRSLTRDEVRRVARLALDRVRRRRGLDEAGVTLELSEAALDRFAEDGYSVAYGARALRRHLDEHLAAPVARLLAGLGGDTKELTLDVTLGEEPEVRREGVMVSSGAIGAFRFDLRRRKSQKVSTQSYGFDVIAGLRRSVDRQMRLSSVEQLKDQIDFLVTQLSLDDAGKADARRAREMAELQAEHYRLNELWQRLVAAQEEVRAVEELGMLALFEGQEVMPLLADAHRAETAFRKALPHALTALEPRRDTITLIIEELDPGAFDDWFPPLLQAIGARGWSATLHLEGGERLTSDEWPESRRFGPPRSPTQVLAALAADKRTFRSVLLRIKGAYAGVLLTLEAGLHRTIYPKKGDGKGEDSRLHVFVHRVALETEIPSDAWKHPTLQPPTVAGVAARRKEGVMRDRDRVEGVLRIAGKRGRLQIDLDDYWGHLEEIALEHLLLFEEEGSTLDRSDWFVGALGDDD